ncbi:MAG: hypothetical protein E6I39_11700 [Chloroflexi bacterium]|nr:MAG: hypothetical protein E6I98_04305 [Chloroflexota bacterium]TME97773.1 MAG: hypothetical protein E6I39_11700 [Chloroflexota bacterium]
MPSDSDLSPEQDRRMAKRRSEVERRFGERRSPERAAPGRRVVFIDRRVTERRTAQNLAYQPA